MQPRHADSADASQHSHVVANMESMFVWGATLHAQRSCANGKWFHRVPCIVRSRGPAAMRTPLETAVRAADCYPGRRRVLTCRKEGQGGKRANSRAC